MAQKTKKKTTEKKKRRFGREQEDERRPINDGKEAMGEKNKKKRKRKKSKDRSDRQSEMEGIEKERGRNFITDERFASAHSDPRFQRMSENVAKVSLDSRFASMFEDGKFGLSGPPVDKRGRRRKKEGRNPLSEYYHLVKEDRGEASVSLNSAEDEEISGFPGSDLDQSSSSEESENGEDEMDSQIGFGVDGWTFWTKSQEEAPMIEQETRRLAVVNMDWDHIKAVDMYVLMTTTLLSCPQSGGQILSVAVYPSDFGLKCMEIEATRGPLAVVDDLNGSSDEEENDSEDEVMNEKIRSYQLQRLRYYYAVVECDSSVTASHLYNALDGVAFLKTANVLDLRFIPDSMTFIHSPRDVATEVPVNYRQPNLETTALQQVSVKLTWDEDEPDRKKILRRKFKPDQMDELEQYLASEDSEEEDEEDGLDDLKVLDKYQALLHDGGNDDDDNDDDDDDDENDRNNEMEVTFLPGVENISRHIDKSKLKKSEETVWEAALRRRREKNKSRSKNKAVSSDDEDDDADAYKNRLPDGDGDDFFADEGKAAAVAVPSKKGRRKQTSIEVEAASAAELELLLANEDVEGEHIKGFNLRPKKGKKNKKKNKDEDLSMAAEKLPQVDAAADPRFNSRLSSSLYALDPTDPLFKRSAMGMRLESGVKRNKAKTGSSAAGEERLSLPAALPPPPEQAGNEKLEIMSLVRSLKLKTKALS